MRASAVVFWGLVAYALGGALSGVLLGPDWLIAKNDGGIARWAMLVPAIALSGAAAIMRLSILRRGRDGVARYVSLLSVALLCCAVTQGNVGWLGRFGTSPPLWAFHCVMILTVPVICSIAILATARVAMASKRIEFRRPAFLVVAGWLSCLALVLRDLVVPTWGSFSLWVASSAILCAAALRVAYLIPATKGQPNNARIQHVPR